MTSVPGRMYEVNINSNPDQFLGWDKPLSKQPGEIQQALGQIGYFGEGRKVAEGYRKLASDYGGPDMASGKLMHEAGIPGIKYLDQGSRTAGEGSRKLRRVRRQVDRYTKKIWGYICGCTTSCRAGISWISK